jgi:hypothetical protein
MDLCRDDVPWLALGIERIGLGTNLEDIPREIHVLIDQHLLSDGRGGSGAGRTTVRCTGWH